MVTLSPEPSSSSSESHRARGLAESFGADPERYDRTRPRYPQAMADRVLAASPGRDVLDVGIGTGVSAQPFAAAGCRVLGMEADPRMARFARSRGFEVEMARFEEWDPEGRTFDVVASGQAWHWVDPAAGAAMAARVLRPGGRLAVFWNVFEPSAALAEQFGAVYRRVFPADSPFAHGVTGGLGSYQGQLAKAEDGMSKVPGFGAPERWRLDWQRRFAREEWLEQMLTFGGHSQFPPDVLDRLLAGIGSVIDAVGGVFTMNYTTVVVTAGTSLTQRS